MASIRPATIDDIDELVRLRVAFIRELSPLSDDEAEKLGSVISAGLLESMPTGDFRAWVAEDGDRLVASSGLFLDRRLPNAGNPAGWDAYLLNMYTEPGYRRQGLATALMQECIAFAKTTPARHLRLHATTDGRPLYEKAGFVPTTSEMTLGL